VNVLLQLLLAAGLIALMIVVRMVSDRRIMRQRRACGQMGKAECSGGCHEHEH
jgi:hypothetical protein